MSYQEVFADLEDFASELNASKAKKVWYRIEKIREPVKGEREMPLMDGTRERKEIDGFVGTTKITLTALGYLNPSDAKPMGSSLNPEKPDTQLVFSMIIAQKEIMLQNEFEEYEKDVEAGWKGVLGEVKKAWAGAFFEGVGSII